MRVIRWVTAGILATAISVYMTPLVWPAYTWDLRLSSPDGRYDLVVLRGDKVAFDDFFYHLYVFPHYATPRDQIKASRVWLTPPWRGDKYLLYSGYNYPMFRWTGTHSIEIDLTDLYLEPFVLESVKRFNGSSEPILTSVVFGREDPKNARP